LIDHPIRPESPFEPRSGKAMTNSVKIRCSSELKSAIRRRVAALKVDESEWLRSLIEKDLTRA